MPEMNSMINLLIIGFELVGYSNVFARMLSQPFLWLKLISDLYDTNVYPKMKRNVKVHHDSSEFNFLISIGFA